MANVKRQPEDVGCRKRHINFTKNEEELGRTKRKRTFSRGRRKHIGAPIRRIRGQNLYVLGRLMKAILQLREKITDCFLAAI